MSSLLCVIKLKSKNIKKLVFNLMGLFIVVANAQGGDLGCSVDLLELLSSLAHGMVLGESS